MLPFGFGLLTTTFTLAFAGGREGSASTQALADHVIAYYESGGEATSPISFDVSVHNTGTHAHTRTHTHTHTHAHTRTRTHTHMSLSIFIQNFTCAHNTFAPTSGK